MKKTSRSVSSPVRFDLSPKSCGSDESRQFSYENYSDAGENPVLGELDWESSCIDEWSDNLILLATELHDLFYLIDSYKTAEEEGVLDVEPIDDKKEEFVQKRSEFLSYYVKFHVKFMDDSILDQAQRIEEALQYIAFGFPRKEIALFESDMIEVFNKKIGQHLNRLRSKSHDSNYSYSPISPRLFLPVDDSPQTSKGVKQEKSTNPPGLKNP